MRLGKRQIFMLRKGAAPETRADYGGVLADDAPRVLAGLEKAGLMSSVVRPFCFTRYHTTPAGLRALADAMEKGDA